MTIPFDPDFIDPSGRNWGNSALSIGRFARGMNLIFLDTADAAQAGLADMPLTQGPVGLRYF